MHCNLFRFDLVSHLQSCENWNFLIKPKRVLKTPTNLMNKPTPTLFTKQQSPSAMESISQCPFPGLFGIKISKTCGVYERGGHFLYFRSYSLDMKRSLLMILGHCYVAVGARKLPSHMATSNLKQYKNACFWYSRIMYRKMKGGVVPLYFFPLPLTGFFFLSNTISPLVRTGMVFRLAKPA